jgi:hypothetical protein
MRFRLRSVDASLFETAPWRFVTAVEVPASAAEVFHTFEDGAQWPRWFKGIRRVTWTSPKPYGVGTTRTVELDALTVFEHFFRWQSGERFSFYVTHATVPLFRALAEDYLLEDLAPGRCRFTYTVAIEPGLLGRLLSPVLRGSLGRQFSAAAHALPEYVRDRS